MAVLVTAIRALLRDENDANGRDKLALVRGPAVTVSPNWALFFASRKTWMAVTSTGEHGHDG